MNLKKLLSVLLCVAMLLSLAAGLAGCGDKATEENGADQNQSGHTAQQLFVVHIDFSFSCKYKTRQKSAASFFRQRRKASRVSPRSVAPL